MKLLTKLLLSLLLLFAALAGASYLLPTKLEVQRSITLHASPEEVYSHLDNPTQWEKWTVLNKQEDPTMICLYGGPLSGTGARMKWSGDRVGNGQVLLTESIAPVSLLYQEKLGDDTSSVQGAFSLTATAGGTELVWRQQAAFGTKPWNRLHCMLVTFKKQDETEKGLLGLKTLLSGKSKKKASL